MTNIFLTGRPGVGKTTVMEKVIEQIDKKVGGFFTPEVRKDGRRIGFKLKRIDKEEEGVLASVNVEDGPKVSKYKVNLQDLSRFSENIIQSLDRVDMIAIDEIGKMELYSERFRKTVERAINSEKPFLATLHRNYVREFGEKGEVIEVTRKNRDELPEKILRRLEEGQDSG